MNYDELIKTLKEDHDYWKQPILVTQPDGETFYMTYWGEKGSFYYLSKCNGVSLLEDLWETIFFYPIASSSCSTR